MSLLCLSSLPIIQVNFFFIYSKEITRKIQITGLNLAVLWATIIQNLQITCFNRNQLIDKHYFYFFVPLVSAPKLLRGLVLAHLNCSRLINLLRFLLHQVKSQMIETLRFKMEYCFKEVKSHLKYLLVIFVIYGHWDGSYQQNHQEGIKSWKVSNHYLVT